MRVLRAHVAELVETLLDQLAEQVPPADLHQALPVPLPVQVICELLGVPYSDRNQFQVWSAGAGHLSDRQVATDALGQLCSSMQQLIRHKRARPGQDVISDLIAALLSGVVANRDATAFPEPYRFDINRAPNAHLRSATAPASASAPASPASNCTPCSPPYPDVFPPSNWPSRSRTLSPYRHGDRRPRRAARHLVTGAPR
jgi:cytochrome P450